MSYLYRCITNAWCTVYRTYLRTFPLKTLVSYIHYYHNKISFLSMFLFSCIIILFDILSFVQTHGLYIHTRNRLNYWAYHLRYNNTCSSCRFFLFHIFYYFSKIHSKIFYHRNHRSVPSVQQVFFLLKYFFTHYWMVKATDLHVYFSIFI